MRSHTLAGFPAVGQPGPGKDPSAMGLGEGSLWVRVVVRTPSVESFVQKYSRFLKDDRIFIFTKSSQAPGTRLRFTLELADGKALVSGAGTVTRVRPDVGDPTKPPGMELRFVPTDESSKRIVELMLSERGGHTSTATSTREMPPAPKSAILPALPQTGAHGVFDPPPALPTPAAPPVVSPAVTVSPPASAPKPITPPPPAKKPFAEPTPFAKPAGPSPLLSRPIAGQKTDLPKRPGTLTRTIMGPGPVVQPPVPPAIALAVAAAAPTAPALERPPSIVDRPLPPPLRPPPAMAKRRSETIPSEMSDAETTGVGLASDNETTGVKEARAAETASVEEPNEPSIMAPPPTPDDRAVALARTLAFEGPLVPPAGPSGLDPDSLFSTAEATETVETDSERAAWGLRSGQTDAEPETKREVPPRGGSKAAPSDDLSRSFDGLDAPSSFAEAWRDETENDVRADTVPANPFSEVSDNAIEYFVEWSLDRAPNAAPRTSFDAVAMSTPGEESVVAPLPTEPTSVDARPVAPTYPTKPTLSPFAPLPEPVPERSGTKLGLIIGLAMGLAIGGGAMLVIRSNNTPPPEPAPFKIPDGAKTNATTPDVAKPDAPKPVATVPAIAKATDTGTETASFSISSKPPGAMVSIDGIGRGVTPLTLKLSTGEHQAELTLDRYARLQSAIEAPGSLEADLKRPHAHLVFHSTPPGADVKVAGVKRGKTPLTLGVLAYENYFVELTLPNTPPWRRKVYAKAPTTAVDAQLVITMPKPKGAGPKQNAPAGKPSQVQNGKAPSPVAKPPTLPPRPGDLLSPNRGIR